jgi:PPP family 3-phenylpropionic acid transporter
MACMISLFSSAVIPLLDSTTLGLLGDHPEQYGRQRIWGSIGYVCSTAGTGFILQQAGLHALFALYAQVMAAMVIVGARLPAQPVSIGVISLRGVGRMLRQPAWLVFAVSIFLLGLGFSGVSNFVSVTIKTMGGTDVLIGIAWTLSAASELPVLFFSAALLRRMGSQRLLAVALTMYVGRMLLYAVMPAPEWVLGIHAVFGAGFGIYWMSAVSYANELAPAALRTTAQSLLTSTTSLANVIGALMCGWLFDRLGPPGLFAVLAICCMTATIIFAAGRLVIRRNAT